MEQGGFYTANFQTAANIFFNTTGNDFHRSTSFIVTFNLSWFLQLLEYESADNHNQANQG